MLRVLVIADDGDATIRPIDRPFGIWARAMGNEYDCGSPRLRAWAGLLIEVT